MMVKVIEGGLTTKGKRFGLVTARFNEFISNQLVEGAVDTLRRCGCEEEEIEIVRVPGSFEIPYAARKLAQSKRFDAVLCLGAVIRGDTPHFDYISTQVARGIAESSASTGIPVIFGVITADTLEQAIERAGTKAGNKGRDAALSAIEMVNLYDALKGDG